MNIADAGSQTSLLSPLPRPVHALHAYGAFGSALVDFLCSIFGLLTQWAFHEEGIILLWCGV